MKTPAEVHAAALAERDAAMLAMRKQGAKLQEIADRFGIGVSAVSKRLKLAESFPEEKSSCDSADS